MIGTTSSSSRASCAAPVGPTSAHLRLDGHHHREDQPHYATSLEATVFIQGTARLHIELRGGDNTSSTTVTSTTDRAIVKLAEGKPRDARVYIARLDDEDAGHPAASMQVYLNGGPCVVADDADDASDASDASTEFASVKTTASNARSTNDVAVSNKLVAAAAVDACGRIAASADGGTTCAMSLSMAVMANSHRVCS